MIQLAPDWRVRPLDELQWVLERRRPGLYAGGERWDAQAFCRTRAGLETALSRLKCGWKGTQITLDPALIAHLPDYFIPDPAPRELVDATA